MIRSNHGKEWNAKMNSGEAIDFSGLKNWN